MSLQSPLSAFAVYTNKDLREPEVHIIGEIVGASELSVDNSYCAFEIKTGKFWSCVGGDVNGQTQVDYPDEGEGSMVIWNHPIDVHYYTKTIEGWPKLVFEVWNLDPYGNKNITGYGYLSLPMTSGHHELECSIWRPAGTHREELAEYFLGQVPQLLDTEMLHNTAKAREDRHRLTSIAAGKIHVRVSIVMRHMKEHDIRM